MSFRFRRSFKIAKGVRLNLSKRGAGVSIGGKGLHVGAGPRGVYTSAGIPGTGLYTINYLGKGKKKRTSTVKTAGGVPSAAVQNIEMPPELAGGSTTATLGCLWFLACVIVLFISWPLGLLGIAAQITWLIVSSSSPAGKAKSSFLQGQKAYKNGEWKNALDCFLKVLELKPDVHSLYQPIALLYRNLDMPEQSIAYLEKHLAIHPDDMRAKLNYAVALGDTGTYQKAVEVLQGLPPDARRELPVINILAHAFLGLDRPELALEVLEEGPLRSRRAMDENMKTYRYLLGSTYKKLGEKKKALRQFQKIYVEDTGYADIKDLLKELDPSFA